MVRWSLRYRGESLESGEAANVGDAILACRYAAGQWDSGWISAREPLEMHVEGEDGRSLVEAPVIITHVT